MGQKLYFWWTLDQPIMASQPTNSSALATQLQASQILKPANKALAGKVSRVSNSSSNMSHPSSFFVWTIKQTYEFVSVDSLINVYVLQYMGESGLCIKTASALVPAAHI